MNGCVSKTARAIAESYRLAANPFTVNFDKPGNYDLTLRDKDGLILAGLSHAVSGKGSMSHTGTVDIVADKTLYQPGETAKMLITFPEPIDEALLTLERDRVEQQSLLSHPANWLTLQRLNDTQYEARVPVSNSFAPNITFSVLYTRNGQYSFQNAGIESCRSPAGYPGENGQNPLPAW